MLNHIFFLGVKIESNLPTAFLEEAVSKISSHNDFHSWWESELKRQQEEYKEQERRKIKGQKWIDGNYELTKL